MDVFDNVAFPLTVAKPRLSRNDIEALDHDLALEAVGLDALARRPATALSGGQQQRVALLARALIREPEVLLLDEPLSNLDAKLREQMREEIRVIQQKIGITTVFVTHDQSEALAISDLILLMDDGKIVEFGDPQNSTTRRKRPTGRISSASRTISRARSSVTARSSSCRRGSPTPARKPTRTATP